MKLLTLAGVVGALLTLAGVAGALPEDTLTGEDELLELLSGLCRGLLLLLDKVGFGQLMLEGFAAFVFIGVRAFSGCFATAGLDSSVCFDETFSESAESKSMTSPELGF